jgi:DME family drug/metabolite transporter
MGTLAPGGRVRAEADRSLKPALLLVAAAVLFSTGGFAIKAVTLTSWQVASFRSLIAGLVLVIALPASRNWSWRLLPVAITYAAMLTSFVAATKLTTAANAIFLQSTALLYLLVIGPVFLKERLRRIDIVAIVTVAAGMSLFFVAEERSVATAPDPRTGNIIAAASGLAWALTLAGLRHVGRQKGRNDGPAVVAMGSLIGFAACLPLALPVQSISAADLAGLLYLGCFQIAVAYWCLTRAMRHVPAFQAATILMLEPALNPLWTWLTLGERPSSLAIGGGVLILGASLLHAWVASRTESEAGASG